MEKIFVSQKREDTQNFAKDLAEKILAGKIGKNFDAAVTLALFGDLGAGKTTFAQGFAEGLRIKEKTKSPTFIIFRKSKINQADTGQKLKLKYFYHFDVYRIHNEKEILNLGWEEIIKNPENIVLVEWADKIENILPKDCLKIYFKHLQGDKREITSNFQ